MKFTAKSDVEALEYDFRPYVDAAGTVPEPTQAVMVTFLDYFDDLTEQNQKATEQSLQARANALQAQSESGQVVITGDLPAPDVSDDPEPVKPADPEKRTWRQIVLGEDDKSREFADHIAGLCQNQPTGDQIWGLPPRIRREFTNMAVSLFILGDDSGGKAPAGTSS